MKFIGTEHDKDFAATARTRVKAALAGSFQQPAAATPAPSAARRGKPRRDV